MWTEILPHQKDQEEELKVFISKQSENDKRMKDHIGSKLSSIMLQYVANSSKGKQLRDFVKWTATLKSNIIRKFVNSFSKEELKSAWKNRTNITIINSTKDDISKQIELIFGELVY